MNFQTEYPKPKDFPDMPFPKDMLVLALVGLKVEDKWYDLHWIISCFFHREKKDKVGWYVGCNEHRVDYKIKKWVKLPDIEDEK